ncbi:CHASE3 domain-containing protein [Sphingomonas quercus]|uniref:histidine kinase n=1 Tax=Sphingomonas quercus TaxID=2842451 RepID=A0ABS6BLJ5_9SPHN|nr:CHASE3 domain-containing protein [Sphingomonas quercus]MBU3079175.1 CHASE3 domain-containing protein [Sphingomonas quercus]
MPTIITPGKTPWLPLLGLAVVFLAAAGAFWLVQSERNASRWVAHTISAQLAVSRFEGELVRYESAYRGYVIRPSPPLFREIVASRRSAYATFEQMKADLRDNPAQRARLERLGPLLDEKVATGVRWIRVRREGRLAEELGRDRSERGRILTAMIRTETAELRAEEERLLRVRQSEAQRLSAAISSGLAGAVLLVMIVAVLMVRDANVRGRAMAESRDEAIAAQEAAIAAAKAQEEAEDKLRQMQKMEAVGQLTGGIAHDFNNMLAIVIGSLDLASRRLEDPERLKRAISNAREGAERAAALTGRLLAFSRQSPLAPVPIDANRLVSGMSELLRRTLGEHIAIEAVLAGGLWPTFADPGEVENALLNLAVNARDAMAGAKLCKLTIETANAHFDDRTARERIEVQPGQYVMIGVTDTGCGMAPEVIERAFDPFFTTKEVGKGTGLGLSQVFGFAKQSGGHAAIYSEPGHGTTVKLYLPRYHGPATVLEMPAATPAPRSSDGMPLGSADEIILVCEDEQRVRHFSVDALRELGYTALSATEGTDALRLLTEVPGVVMLFTDIVMPGISGRVLADRAREIRPELKVLYTTGYTRNAVVHNGMLDPGVAFLAKPFTMSQLANKVRDVLDGRGANRPPVA